MSSNIHTDMHVDFSGESVSDRRHQSWRQNFQKKKIQPLIFKIYWWRWRHVKLNIHPEDSSESEIDAEVTATYITSHDINIAGTGEAFMVHSENEPELKAGTKKRMQCNQT